MSFYNKIKNICKEHSKVALFVDMDGTIVEYKVFPENYISNTTKELFINAKPLDIVIKNLNELNDIDNLDIYILTLAKSKIILEEKKQWLKRYLPFIEEDNYIIVCKENGEYSSENREYIKVNKMQEKLNGTYDYVILLDDDHKILKTTQKELADNGRVFHVSSALI